jgi:hypothetical protein
MRRKSAPSSPTVIVFVRDETGDVFHYSANSPEAAPSAIEGARDWLRYVRRPAYLGRKPCGQAEVVTETIA